MKELLFHSWLSETNTCIFSIGPCYIFNNLSLVAINTKEFRCKVNFIHVIILLIIDTSRSSMLMKTLNIILRKLELVLSFLFALSILWLYLIDSGGPILVSLVATILIILYLPFGFITLRVRDENSPWLSALIGFGLAVCVWGIASRLTFRIAVGPFLVLGILMLIIGLISLLIIDRRRSFKYYFRVQILRISIYVVISVFFFFTKIQHISKFFYAEKFPELHEKVMEYKKDPTPEKWNKIVEKYNELFFSRENFMK